VTWYRGGDAADWTVYDGDPGHDADSVDIFTSDRGRGGGRQSPREPAIASPHIRGVRGRAGAEPMEPPRSGHSPRGHTGAPPPHLYKPSVQGPISCEIVSA
jgi:hypothetical protein